MPKIYLLAVVSLVVAIIIALVYWWGRGNANPGQVETTQVEANEAMEPTDTSDPQPPALERPQATQTMARPTVGVCSDVDVACLSDPFAANSEEDIAWMRRHGYPTSEEANRLKLLSEAQLEHEVSGGSLTAMTELAGRKIERSDWSGLQLLSQASDRGSIYSNYVRSSAMLKKGAPMAGMIESGAYLRLAYILGDYKAAGALQNDFQRRHSLTPKEMSRIDERAASLYRTYARNKAPVSRPR